MIARSRLRRGGSLSPFPPATGISWPRFILPIFGDFLVEIQRRKSRHRPDNKRLLYGTPPRFPYSRRRHRFRRRCRCRPPFHHAASPNLSSRVHQLACRFRVFRRTGGGGVVARGARGQGGSAANDALFDRPASTTLAGQGKRGRVMRPDGSGSLRKLEHNLFAGGGDERRREWEGERA